MLLLLAALVYRPGIGLIPPGNTSHVEGVIGSCALALLVPIYLHLSGRLAATNRPLGATTTITGLFGAVAGLAMMYTRVLEQDLRARGAGDDVWASFYHGPGGEYLAVALLGPLFPLTSTLISGSVSFARARFPRGSPGALVVAGISFPSVRCSSGAWGSPSSIRSRACCGRSPCPAAGARSLGRDGD